MPTDDTAVRELAEKIAEALAESNPMRGRTVAAILPILSDALAKARSEQSGKAHYHHPHEPCNEGCGKLPPQPWPSRETWGSPRLQSVVADKARQKRCIEPGCSEPSLPYCTRHDWPSYAIRDRERTADALAKAGRIPIGWVAIPKEELAALAKKDEEIGRLGRFLTETVDGVATLQADLDAAQEDIRSKQDGLNLYEERAQKAEAALDAARSVSRSLTRTVMSRQRAVEAATSRADAALSAMTDRCDSAKRAVESNNRKASEYYERAIAAEAALKEARGLLKVCVQLCEDISKHGRIFDSGQSILRQARAFLAHKDQPEPPSVRMDAFIESVRETEKLVSPPSERHAFVASIHDNTCYRIPTCGKPESAPVHTPQQCPACGYIQDGRTPKHNAAVHHAPK